MKRLETTGCGRFGFVLALALACAASSAPAAYVITLQGQRVDGTEIRAKSDGEIILTTPQGTRSFFQGQYMKAVADKPAEIDKAAQLIEAKQFDEAAKLLEDVILKYRYLDWDVQARTMLPQVYVRKGDMAGAVAAYDKLFAAAPKTKEDAEVLWSYRQALLDAKQFDKLEQQLNDVIANGSRPDAARAQIMRGDIRVAQNQLESAMLDYMRTVVLFEKEKDAQPEALYKAAETLKALRDPRSAEMAKKLVEQYPSSPYAAKAKQGL